jgi:uncharacterized membrane protein YdjX (TVP38/TMEM64 family)
VSAAVRRRGRKRRIGALLLVIAVVAGVAWYAKTHLTLEGLVMQEQQLRESIELWPWRSFAIGLAIYAVVSLIPGTSGKSVIFGWLFGFWRALIIVIVGLTAAAVAMFYLSRLIFRHEIESRYGRFLTTLNRHLQKEGAFYLLTLRMAHFPYSIINLASGASRVRVQTFCWTTAVGLLPGTIVYVWVGIRLPSLDELVRRGAGSLIDAPLIAALALSAVSPVLFRWFARRLGVVRSTDSTSHLPKD